MRRGAGRRMVHTWPLLNIHWFQNQFTFHMLNARRFQLVLNVAVRVNVGEGRAVGFGMRMLYGLRLVRHSHLLILHIHQTIFKIIQSTIFPRSALLLQLIFNSRLGAPLNVNSRRIFVEARNPGALDELGAAIGTVGIREHDLSASSGS